MRQLGDPKPGREAARRGDMVEFRTIFTSHLASEESQIAIREAATVAQQETVALMCYERAPKDCHRSIVAEHIRDLVSVQIVHLGAPSGQAARRTIDDGGS